MIVSPNVSPKAPGEGDPLTVEVAAAIGIARCVSGRWREIDAGLMPTSYVQRRARRERLP
jgi:hypothetical protein